MARSKSGPRDSPPIPFASSEVEMPLDLALPRRVSRLRSTRTAIKGFALMLPLASLWRIARRDLATRIRGLRLLAVCLFLGVAPPAAGSEEPPSELQSLMRPSLAVFRLKQK